MVCDIGGNLEPGVLYAMKHVDQYAGIFWFLVGGATTGASFYYGIGSLSTPGPGFITFLAGALLTLLSLLLIIVSGRNTGFKSSLRQLWEGKQPQKAFYVLFLLVMYMLILTPVGFLLATFVLLLFLFRVQGKYSMKMVTFISALTTFLAFIFFDQWLGVQLPRGFMGYFLF